MAQTKCPKCGQTALVSDGPDPRCKHCGAALPTAPLREAVSERAPSVPPQPKPGWERRRDDDYDDRPRYGRGAPSSSSSTTIIVVIVLVAAALLLVPILGVVFWFLMASEGDMQVVGPAAMPPMEAQADIKVVG